jgi:hypothetical protein
MSKAQVKSLIKSFSYGYGEADNIIARKDNYSRFYSLNFCKDKLVLVQKELNASVKEFIILFDQLTSIYCKPMDSHTSIGTLESIGSRYAISFFWLSGVEIINIDYTVFPKNDHFSITYEIKNDCF